MTLAPDVAAAVDQLRREKAVGVSEAVNELIATGQLPEADLPVRVADGREQRRRGPGDARGTAKPLMLVDASILLFAVLEASTFFDVASRWLEGVLSGPARVGLPWLSLTAFLRIATNPRATDPPLRPDEAWSVVDGWLGLPGVWIPRPTERHAPVLGGLVTRHHLTGNLIPDAEIAALAIEHGLVVCSADTDFARFDEIRWENPLP